MSQDKRFFDECAKLFGDGLSAIGNLKAEVDNMVRCKMESYLSASHITREEFDVVKQMAEKARTEQEKLSQRILELESQVKDNDKK